MVTDDKNWVINYISKWIERNTPFKATLITLEKPPLTYYSEEARKLRNEQKFWEYDGTEHIEEHKELHNKIKDCSCIPIKQPYCVTCTKTVVDFMNHYGAGILTQDTKIERLQKENSQLNKKNTSLNKQLNEKTNRVQQLKKKIEEGEKNGRSINTNISN